MFGMSSRSSFEWWYFHKDWSSFEFSLILFQMIVDVKALKSKRILSASQNRNREFIILIASIYANELYLLPILIY
jgi:hypothetical protein